MRVRAALGVSLAALTFFIAGTSSAVGGQHAWRASPETAVIATTSQATDAVSAYWTRQRMREARPVPMPDALAGAADGVVDAEARPRIVPPALPSGEPDRSQTPLRGAQSDGDSLETRSHVSGSRTEVTDTTAFPARTHGRVFFSLPDGDFVCSATTVNAANESLVVTAGHCVHEGGSGGSFATNWMFAPGYHDNKAPFGGFAATTLATTAAWHSSADTAHDVGFAVVGTSSGGSDASLQDTVGARGIGFNQAREQRYRAFGYPATTSVGVPPTAFDGQSLYVCDSPYGGDDSTGNPAPMRITCDQTSGASGGGWVVHDSFVQSVISYGYVAEPDDLYGPYFGSAVRNVYDVAQQGPEAQPDPQSAPTVPMLPSCFGETATHVGTARADVIVGTRADEVIVGLGGNDRINGWGGKDLICAGSGRDLVRGKNGRDRLAGEGGKDRLAGGRGRDLLHGGRGRDVCAGGPGKDRARKCERARGIR